MAQTIFKLSKPNISYAYQETGVKTLTRSSGAQIPSTNVRITAITLKFNNIYLKRMSNNRYFITDVAAGDIGTHFWTSGIDYVWGDEAQNPLYESTISYNKFGLSEINMIHPFKSDYDSTEVGTFYSRTLEIKVPINNSTKAKVTGTDTVNVNLVKYNEVSSAQIEKSGSWTMTVDWEERYTFCTPPTSVVLQTGNGNVTEHTLGKGQSITLSWSGAKAGVSNYVSGNNAITGYKIYKNGGWLADVGPTQTSYAVTSSQDTNSTDIYQVETIGTLTNYKNSGLSSAKAVLKTYWSDIVISSFTCNGKTTTQYVGKKDATLKFAWAATAGTNNAINQYKISYGNTEKTITGTTSFSIDSTDLPDNNNTFSFKLTAVGQSSNTTSSSITINIVQGASQIGFSGMSQYILKDFNQQLTLDSLSASTYNCSSIKYNLLYSTSTGSNSYYNSWQSSWEQTINFTNKVNRGTYFTLSVTIQYNALHGGSTEKTYQVIPSDNTTGDNAGKYIVVGKHKAPVITSVYDEKAANKAGISTRGCGKIIIKADPAQEDTSVASNNVFSYQLFSYDVKYSNTIKSWPVTINDDGKLESAIDLNQYTAGSQIEFYIESKDDYELTSESQKHKISQLIPITITTSSVNVKKSINKSIDEKSICYNTVSPIFSFNYDSTIAEDKTGALNQIYYSINLKESNMTDDTSFYTLVEKTHPTSTTINDLTSDNIRCNQTPEQDLEDQLYNQVIENQNPQQALENQLYNQVIKKQNPHPSGEAIIKIWYENYEEYAIIEDINFNFDFVTPLVDLVDTDIYFEGIKTSEDGKKYINPLSNISIHVKQNTWTNAIGLPSDATIVTKILEGTTLLKEGEGDPNEGYVYKANYFYNNNTIRDQFITFTIVQQLMYADGVVEEEITKEISVPMAKWGQEIIKIKSLNYKAIGTDKYGFQGTLLIPLGNLGSTVYKNANETIGVTIAELQNGETNNLLGFTLNRQNDKDAGSEVEFTTDIINGLAKSNKDIIISLTFTNSSGEQIATTTPSFSLTVAEVTVAMRKGKICLNTSQDYASTESELEAAPILQINNMSGSSSTLLKINSLNMPGKESPETLIHLQAQGGFNSIFKTDGSNLIITGLNIGENSIVVSDENGLLSFSSVSADKLGYLADVTGNIQEQLNSKQNNIAGAATTIISNNLTGNKVLISNNSGKVAASNITNTELSYLSGVTQSIQTQLNGKAAAFQNQTKNTVFAGPVDGDSALPPAFRTLVAADIPSLNASIITSGTLPVGRGGTGATKIGAEDGGALNILGITYATSKPAFSANDKGKICLVKKG